MRLIFTVISVVGVLLLTGIISVAQHTSNHLDIETRTAEEANIEILLSSNPFPMSVGMADMIVLLSDDEGNPIDDAIVEVHAQMNHHGMGLPLYGQDRNAQDGIYETQLIWSMTGLWDVAVLVYLPDSEIPVGEFYEIYIYPTMIDTPNVEPLYRSLRENAEFLEEAPNEFRILIPQGTKALVKVGQDRDIIPDEINMSLSGMNTIVIRNDDIDDHTVGPFFIRSGEVIRQRFTRETVYEGVCSVNFLAEIRIVVEK